MAKDWDLNAHKGALDRYAQQTNKGTVASLEQELRLLRSQCLWLESQVAHMRSAAESATKRLNEEMRQHNDLYRALEARKVFDDWLKDAYPEVIEQYKAAMKLVEFMEDPQKAATAPGRFQWGWGNNQVMIDKFRQQWVTEMEIEKAKIEAERELEIAKRFLKGK